MTTATGTSLTIIVPHADCLPPRREELRVAVGSKSDARTVGVTPRSEEDLELPQDWYRYTYAGNGCVHLPASGSGGEFLVGVASISEDPASLTAVALTGTPGDASVVGAQSGRVIVLAAGEPGQSMGAEGMAALTEGPFRTGAGFHLGAGSRIGRSVPGSQEWPLADDTLRMRRARAHSEIMTRNQALLRRLGRATPPALADARRDLQVGDTLTLFADPDATCSSAGQVRAVVRLVGNSSIWLDDRDNPVATFTDAELANLDAFYLTYTKGVHDNYFGGLSDVDGNGRFLVLMTKEVNRVEHLQGWVRPNDLRSGQSCATSNRAEIFYGKVPDPHGSVGDTATKQTLLDQYPSLITHELTHLVQANAWVFGNAGDKASWEWEGGASLAEQLVAYRLFGHGSGRDLGAGAYNASEEARRWYWNSWLGDLTYFFGWDYRGDGRGRITGAPEQCSWVGLEREGNSGPCLGYPAYGVASMVFRYAMDRWGGEYPGRERALMRRLTQSPAKGFASLVDVSPDREWRIEQILANFYLSLWLDLQPDGSASGMSSWDLHDIFSRFRENAQLEPYTSSATRPRLSARARAGSSLYLHWTPRGALSPTSIKVTSPGGGRIASHMSIWVYRVR